MSTLDSLSRLAAKPGVQSTLILSKADGSIIRSSGLLASSLPPASSASAVSSAAAGGSPGNTDISEGGKIGTYYEVESNDNTNGKRAEDVAKMVFSFVSGAGGLVQGMDEEDELKLLRIRTRKSEIVIVPGQSLPLIWTLYTSCFGYLGAMSYCYWQLLAFANSCYRFEVPLGSRTRYTSGLKGSRTLAELL